MAFTLPALPYAHDALEPHIDKLTMEIHHGKHHNAYVTNLNKALEGSPDADKSIEDLQKTMDMNNMPVRNNGGGHYNHELFWQCMQPKKEGNMPSGKIMEAITKAFGSFDEFKKQFADAGKNRFGSGWAWLYVDAGKNLKIGSSPNQDNPLMDISDIKGYPLLALDVWEHAYYLKYQNKRADYIDNWWNVVNWNYVQQRFDKMS